jgi:hypothetical protein
MDKAVRVSLVIGVVFYLCECTADGSGCWSSCLARSASTIVGPCPGVVGGGLWQVWGWGGGCLWCFTISATPTAAIGGFGYLAFGNVVPSDIMYGFDSPVWLIYLVNCLVILHVS